MQQSFGALKSPPDGKDYPAAAFLPSAPPPMPPTLSYRGVMQPVRAQGAKGSCTSFATASGVGGRLEQVEGVPGKLLSPDDLYDQSRIIMPVPGGAQGSYARAAYKVWATTGIALELDRPYTDQTSPPASPVAVAGRVHNMIDTYASASLTTEEIQLMLYHYGAGTLSYPVDQGFANPSSDGTVTPGGIILGGHSIAVIGWKPGYWEIRNSWGPGYGDVGYAWIPWTENNKFWECWFPTGKLVDGKPVPPQYPWWEIVLQWLHR